MTKQESIHYIMKFVDAHYKYEDRQGADERFGEIVESFREAVKRDFSTDRAFEQLLLAIYIPDHYEQNGSKEKLYSKLIEVLVAIWSERMGFNAHIPTQKSNREDVRIAFKDKLIVADVKTFRMGRSQQAPNIKDFIKVSSFRKWMTQAESPDHAVLGGLITYPKSHEWSEKSEVYRLCSLKDTPIVMLSYNELAMLLHYKNAFDTSRFFELWDYETLFPAAHSSVSNKKHYHAAIDHVIKDWLKDVKSTQYKRFVTKQQRQYEAVKESHLELLGHIKEQIEIKAEKETAKKTEEEVRAELIRLMMLMESERLEKYEANIESFR